MPIIINFMDRKKETKIFMHILNTSATSVHSYKSVGQKPTEELITKHAYMFYKRVILWKQELHQRTENCRVYKFSGPD